MDQIQERIDNFNMTLQAHNMSQDDIDEDN